MLLNYTKLKVMFCFCKIWSIFEFKLLLLLHFMASEYFRPIVLIVSPDENRGYYAFVSSFQIQITCLLYQGLDANQFWALCDSICGH